MTSKWKRPTQHSRQEAYLFSNDKTVMDHRKALAILTEVFEILNKLLEWHKDNATGKVW